MQFVNNPTIVVTPDERNVLINFSQTLHEYCENVQCDNCAMNNLCMDLSPDGPINIFKEILTSFNIE